MPLIGSLSSRSLVNIGISMPAVATVLAPVYERLTNTYSKATVGTITTALTPTKFSSGTMVFNGASKAEIAITSSATVTVECWCYLTTTGGAPFALVGANNQVATVFMDATVNSYWNDITSTYGSSSSNTTTASTGNWIWVVMQMTNTNLSIWVNGAVQTNATLTITGGQDYRQAAKTKLIVGGYSYASQYFNGYIDFIRVSNVARYTAGSAISVPNSNPASDANTLAIVTGNNAVDPSVYLAQSTRAFSAAQSTSKGLYTTDGVTWAQTTMPVSSFWVDTNFNPAAPNRAVAIAWSSSNVAYSSDYGQTWTAGTGLNSTSWNAVAPVSSTTWVAVSDSGVYYSTNNGQTWTVTTGASGTGAAGRGAGLAIIVTGSLTYYRTTNGSTFTNGSFPNNPASATTGFTRIKYVNGYYIVLNSNGRYAITSTDGTSWTVRDVTGPGANYMRDVSYGDGLYIIMADLSQNYYTSTDLATWTTRSMPANRRWCGITRINNSWVAITDGDNIKATSIDGINWTESTLGAATDRWMDLTEVR
jgi:hypothetical protein